jgi:hypothetical protein
MANPNPNIEGLKPFQPGQSGNPGGKTAEQRRLEVEAAEMAAQLRHKMLTALVNATGDDATTLEAIKGDILRLIKDSEDRAHGTPKATTELGGIDGGDIKSSVTVKIIGADDADC